MVDEAIPASFRDPSGFVFLRDGVLHRRVNRRYERHWTALHESGLFAELVRRGLLVGHEQVERFDAGEALATLRPDLVPCVSYPYEWCFSQLRDAALATLEIQRTALRHGMTLKDASAFNVQFRAGRPVWIDTLSFEVYQEGRPWLPYRQFCEHFLAPLALIAHRDARLARLLSVHLDGIPLDLARRLLPARAWWSPLLLAHVRLHARYQRRYRDRPEAVARARKVGRSALEGLIASLRTAVRRLAWEPEAGAWLAYAEGDSYGPRAAEHKRASVARLLARSAPRVVLDLGANTGEYSRIACAQGAFAVACDADAACVERCYRELRDRGETRLLPLVLDLANPSPALGWAGRERATLAQRLRPDALLALALVHHLAIAGNVPLPRIAAWFAELAPHAIVEFVPKSDPKVARLLASREDVFDDYTREGFERAFAAHFAIEAREPIPESERTLYALRRPGG
jgi:hypothetical protein